MAYDGRLIKAARVYYGITQGELAEKAMCDQSTISAMEIGEHSDVSWTYSERAGEILELRDPDSDFVKSVLLTLAGAPSKI